MSHILPPSHFTSGPSSYGSDPFSSYGGDYGDYGDSGAYGGSALDQYYQYQGIAMQALQNGSLSPEERQRWEAYRRSLDQWLNNYQSSMGSSPMQGGGLNEYGGLNPNGNGFNPGFLVGWQDEQHIMTDEGEFNFKVSVKDTEKRRIDAYQDEGTIVIPGSAQAKVTQETDDKGQVHKKITITLTDGSTRVIRFYGTNLKIEAGKKDKVNVDPGLTGVKVTKIGEADHTPQGTPPDDNDPHKWSENDTVDYYVTKGTELDNIYADEVNITLEDRAQIAEVTKIKAHEYEVVIKDAAGNVVRTIHLYQVDKINFNTIDKENFKSKDLTKTPPDAAFKAWSDPTHSTDSQITIGGESGGPGTGEKVNDKDSVAPDEVVSNGLEANYNTSTDLDLYVNYDDPVKVANITTNGTVTLHGSSFDDRVTIARIPGPPEQYQITLIKKINGVDVTEYFNVKGPPSKINFKGVLLANVTYKDGGQPPKAYAAGDDPRISVDGEENQPGAGSTPEIGELARYMGVSEDTIVAAIRELHPEVSADPAAFNEWLQNKSNWLPNPPDKYLTQLLFKVDPALNNLLGRIRGKRISDVKKEVNDIQNRLVEDFKRLYPELAAQGKISGKDGKYHDSDDGGLFDPGWVIDYDVMGITFGGKTFAFYSFGTNQKFADDFDIDDILWQDVTSASHYNWS